MSIRNLEPKALWNNFADLNAIPRPSKKEERVIQFMVEFGENLKLETFTDKIGNIIIKKPESAGMEDRKTVILQSHVDMVHQKNNDTNFDFATQGIEMFIDSDWVKAKGTTLGADNGIGVASIMTVLASDDIVHPPIEAMFTVDEETGMTGAKELEGKYFDGEILLNLDTEDDDELSIGCAGGVDTNTEYSYATTEIVPDSKILQIEVKGLLGGHSGMDIILGRGNSNKWMARVLYELAKSTEYQLLHFDGGSLRNAIPREAVAHIAIASSRVEDIQEKIASIAAAITKEFASIEKEANISSKTVAGEFDKAVAKEGATKILNALYAVFNGVFRMSPDIEGLVETSSSLARVSIENGKFITQSLQRSSVESSKQNIANTIRAVFENMGCGVVQNGDYPGWQPNPNSQILRLMEGLYKEMFNDAPQVKACHAGLECGILGKHLPEVDMISFGPTIVAPHSPDERVQISSVQKYWKYFLEVLRRTPKK